MILTRKDKLRYCDEEDLHFEDLEVQKIGGSLIVGYYIDNGTDEEEFMQLAWYKE